MNYPNLGRRMLEMLRQSLEDKIVAISRSAGSLTYPANFTLIASMNPCPCGYFGDSMKECICSIAIGQNLPASGSANSLVTGQAALEFRSSCC